MDDTVLTLISNSNHPMINKAQLLLQRIKCRQLYVCVGRTPYKHRHRVAEVSQVIELLTVAVMRLSSASRYPILFTSGYALFVGVLVILFCSCGACICSELYTE